jgi:hypothetical protein
VTELDLLDIVRRLHQEADEGSASDTALSLCDELVSHRGWPALDLQVRLEALDAAGAVFTVRYRQAGDAAYLERAIETYENAVAWADPGDPLRPMLLGRLANRLRDRYERTGRRGDLDRVMELSSQAVAQSQAGDAELAGRLNNLGGTWRLLYAAEGDLADLEHAISNFRDAIAAEDDALERAAFESNLAAVLSDRYERTGQLADLNAAITSAEQAVRHTPPDDPDRVTYLGNLAVCMSDRYDRLGDLSDLDRALGILVSATEEADGDPPEMARLWSNLGMLWLSRYERTADAAELDLSIQMAEQAVALTPSSAPELPGYLNNVGNARRLRFERFANTNPRSGRIAGNADFVSAVDAYQRAVDLTPADSPNRPKFLTNLGNALLDRAAARPTIDAIDSAIDALDRAVASTLPDSPDLAGRLNNLASGLHFRHGFTDSAADLHRATRTYEESCRQGLQASAGIALAAAGNWGTWATERRAWPEAVEAYGFALQAADRLRRLQLLREYKQTWLRSCEGLAAGAAFADAMAGQLTAAVLAAERGRALLLADALERDRADLDDLRQHRPSLAERYRAAAELLRSMELGELEANPAAAAGGPAGGPGSAVPPAWD